MCTNEHTNEEDIEKTVDNVGSSDWIACLEFRICSPAPNRKINE